MTKKELWDLMSEEIEYYCAECYSCNVKAVSEFIIYFKYQKTCSGKWVMGPHYICKKCFLGEEHED